MISYFESVAAYLVTMENHHGQASKDVTMVCTHVVVAPSIESAVQAVLADVEPSAEMISVEKIGTGDIGIVHEALDAIDKEEIGEALNIETVEGKGEVLN